MTSPLAQRIARRIRDEARPSVEIIDEELARVRAAMVAMHEAARINGRAIGFDCETFDDATAALCDLTGETEDMIFRRT